MTNPIPSHTAEAAPVPAAERIAAHERATEVLDASDWGRDRAPSDLARTVVEAVADEIDAFGKTLMDKAVKQVIAGKEEGFNATLRAATVQHVAKLVRGTANGGAL